MRRNIEFETENKEIYLGLILVRFFYRLDKKLLAKIKITLKNKNENKEDLREVREHIQDEIQGLETHTFYLCGNRHMISDVKTDLLAHQVPEDYIKTEIF